jgi:predicted RNA binding protein YcfA (HicA-like mRNA interferase family)
MSKQQKALERLLSQPTPADITWEELKRVLQGLGYEEKRNTGSRRKFSHKKRQLVIILHEPHPENTINRRYIEQVVDHLKSNGLIES